MPSIAFRCSLVVALCGSLASQDKADSDIGHFENVFDPLHAQQCAACAAARNASHQAVQAAQPKLALERSARAQLLGVEGVQRLLVRTLHNGIDDFLSRQACRLDGDFCRQDLLSHHFQPDASGSESAAVMGHTGQTQVQTELLFSASFALQPRQVCEVGFNAGHSAATLLGGGLEASYVGFDMPNLNPGLNEELFMILRARLSRPMQIHWGDSMQTLAAFVEQQHLDGCTRRGGPALRSFSSNASGSHSRLGCVQCDLIFVDGAHELGHVLFDVLTLSNLVSSAGHLLLVDDVRCGTDLACAGTTFALDLLIKAKVVRELDCFCQQTPTHFRSTVAMDENRCTCLLEYLPRAVRLCSGISKSCAYRLFNEAGGVLDHWSLCCKPLGRPRSKGFVRSATLDFSGTGLVE